jgi:hypothetical protein
MIGEIRMLRPGNGALATCRLAVRELAYRLGA